MLDAQPQTEGRSDGEIDTVPNSVPVPVDPKAVTPQGTPPTPVEAQVSTAADTPLTPRNTFPASAETQVSTAADANPISPEARNTADTNMSDAPRSPITMPREREVETADEPAATPSSNKVSREREDDTADEPAAKRTKMDHVDDEVQTGSDKVDNTAGDAEKVATEKTSTTLANACPISPEAEGNADTSMPDADLASNKASREREEDPADQPAAKRTKVDAADVETQTVSGNVDETADDADHADDLATDKTVEDMNDNASNTSAANAHLYDDKGQRKSLCDPSLDSHPITEWQNRQIRTVIAGVKKTKAGGHFKAPVAQLWPLLWEDYSAKVTNPTDFSTMEKRLRGDSEGYKTMGAFKADLELLVQNAVKFNGADHVIAQSARAACDSVLQRMVPLYAAEPPRPDKKTTAKQHPTRYVEPRGATAPAATASASKPSPAATAAAPAAALPADLPAKLPAKLPADVPAAKSAVADPPSSKAAENSPAFAIPPGNNGMPLIRRDSKAGNGNKRAVKPTAPRDFPYMAKRKQKLPPEMRFCQDVLQEIKKVKYYDLNQFFMIPVDTVALNIPKYYNIVKKPMDLATMEKKMSDAEYTSVKDFEKDFDQIVKNSRLFNGEAHDVTMAAMKLQDIFKAEMAKKEEWMSKHAPASATSPHAPSNPFSLHKDDSESEDADSGAETDDHGAEFKAAQERLNAIQKHITDEQKKVDAILASADPDITSLEIVQSMVQMLQNKLVEERIKMGTMAPPPKKPAKSKSSKTKKANGAGSKKATTSASSVTTGSRKGGSAKKPAKKRLGVIEKEVVAAGIGELEGNDLERAIDIIKRDTGTGENASGELELDIESLSDGAMWKLYDIAIHAFPHLRAEKEAHHSTTAAAAPAPEPPASKGKASAPKGRKNKPMTKAEQERRIQQLNELRAQVARQGSGSQEPMESIEGNGGTATSPGPVQEKERENEEEHDSEEDESSEEE